MPKLALKLNEIVGFSNPYQQGLAPDDGNVSPAASAFNKFLSNIFGVLTITSGIFFLAYFIIGAISWITSGGDRQKTTEARNKMTYAAIGLVTVAVAYAIASIISVITGIQILNPGEVIQRLGPGG